MALKIPPGKSLSSTLRPLFGILHNILHGKSLRRHLAQWGRKPATLAAATGRS